MVRAQIGPEKRVLRYIREHRLITRRQKLVLAVSGGPDSVCLLHILCGLRRELGIDLHVAHLDHRLRGETSAGDAAYVAGLARKLDIPATIASRDVKAYRARHRVSLEEAAREVRYDFLAEVAAKEGAVGVAVGHTAADHVETVLMHLIRGSGTRGLRGLMPISTLQSVTIIRPLLELTHEETATYCRRHRLHPRDDASNLSPEPLRNRIRHELLPLLRRYNPQVAGALVRTARISADDLDFIGKEATRRYDELARREGEAVILDRWKYLSLPSALKRYILRRAIESVLGNLQDIEAGHVEDVLGALGKPSGKVIGLPGGLDFIIEPERYVLAPEKVSTCPFPALTGEHPLQVPGLTKIPGWNITVSVTDQSAVKDEIGAADEFTAFFDLSKTGRALAVRRLLPGDRFQPLGLEGLKKLNIFMIDAGIPRAWRGRVPLVTAPGQIIWVAGWRIDERVKVTLGTEEVLRMEFERVRA